MRRVWFAAAALLAGCLATPPPPEVLRQALPAGTTVPPVWSTAASPEEVTNDWLASFDDPGLDAVVAEAIANNPDLRQAAARVEVARQLVTVVGSRLKPQIGAQIGAAWTRDLSDDQGLTLPSGQALQVPNQFNSNMEYIGVIWEIDLWGRLRSQRAAAEERAEVAALDYAFGRQSPAATTAKSWYQVTQARQLLALAEDSVKVYANLLELVRVRRAAGKVADFDLVQASASLAAAQSALANAEEAYSEARRAPARPLSRGRGRGASRLRAGPAPVRAGLPSSLIERRPDLGGGRASGGGGVSDAGGREAGAPALVRPHAGRGAPERQAALAAQPQSHVAARHDRHVGPIYQGGALVARVKIATAEQAAAVAHYGAVVLGAFGEVETALTNEGLLAERLRDDQAALGNRTEAVRLGQIRYTAGASDLLTLLILQREQIASQSNVIRLRGAQLANRIDLHLALGGWLRRRPGAVSGAPGVGAAGGPQRGLAMARERVGGPLVRAAALAGWEA
jgi:multidrug efflux system outer membrane protein